MLILVSIVQFKKLHERWHFTLRISDLGGGVWVGNELMYLYRIWTFLPVNSVSRDVNLTRYSRLNVFVMSDMPPSSLRT